MNRYLKEVIDLHVLIEALFARGRVLLQPWSSGFTRILRW